MDAFKQACQAAGVDKFFSTEGSQVTGPATKAASLLGKPFETKMDALDYADTYLVIGEDITKDHQVLSFFMKRRLPENAHLIHIGKADSGFKNFANAVLAVPAGKEVAFLEDLKGLLSNDSAVEKVAGKYGLDAVALAESVKILKSGEKPAVVLGSRYDFADEAAAYNATLNIANDLKAVFISTKGNINSLAAAQLDLDNTVDLSGVELVVLAAGDEVFSQQFMSKFEKVPAMIVFSSYVSPLTAAADVVLPVSNWLEQDGHFLNLDGRLLSAKAALEAPEGIYSNADAFAKLAESMEVKLTPAWESALNAAASIVVD